MKLVLDQAHLSLDSNELDQELVSSWTISMFVVLLIRRRGTFIIDQKRYQKTILERHQGQTYRGYVALSVSVKYVQTDASLCPEFKKHDFTEAFMVYFCRKI